MDELHPHVVNKVVAFDDAPKSSCSIDEAPRLVERGCKNSQRCVGFEPLPMNETKDKSMKYLSDRFFPVRKLPCSAKDLFNDNVEWMVDEDAEVNSSKKDERRGMTVQEVYKMEVLGETAHHDGEIESFYN